MESEAPRTRIDVAIRLALMDRLEPIRIFREGVADVVVALHDGGDRREFRRAAVVEGVGVDGEQRADPIERADRHRSGDDCGNVAVQRCNAGGDRTPLESAVGSIGLHRWTEMSWTNSARFLRFDGTSKSSATLANWMDRIGDLRQVR